MPTLLAPSVRARPHIIGTVLVLTRGLRHVPHTYLPILQVVSRVASLVRKGESLSTVMVGPKETRGARRAALFGLTTEVEVQVSLALMTGTVLSLHRSIAVVV